MNPFSAIIRKLSGLEEAEKKAELVKQRNERVLAPLRQKAASRNINNYRTGKISPTAFQAQDKSIQRSAFDSRPTPKMGWWESNVVDRFSQNTELDKYKRTNDFVRNQDLFRKDLEKQVPSMIRPELRNAYIDSELNKRTTRFQELLNEGQSGWLRNKFDANTVQDRMNRLSKGETEVYLPDLMEGESRGLVGQFTHPLIGSVAKIAPSVFNAGHQLVGSAIQALPGDENSYLDKFGRKYSEVSSNLYGGINEAIDKSRFSTVARAGEVQPLTQISSGVGSLASSIAIAAATKNPWAAASVFGANAAGEQIEGARDAGLSPWQQIAVGSAAGIAEAGLEKVGLDKLFEASGGKTVASRALSGFISEAIQEGSQSITGSAISDIYKDVDYGQAFKDALVEAGYGGIIGSGASVSMGAVQSIVNDPKVKNITKQNIQKQLSEAGKTAKNVAQGKSTLTKEAVKKIDRTIKQKKDKIALDYLPRLAKAKADGKTATVATLEKEIGQLERDIEMLNARKSGEGGYLNLGSDDIDNSGLPQSSPQNKQSSQEASLDNTNPLESLKQEATTYYHGGTKLDKASVANSDLGYSVSSNKDVSKFFTNTKKGGVIEEVQIAPNAKVLSHKDIPQELKDNFTKLDKNKSILENLQDGPAMTKDAERKIVAYARANGYDAIDMNGPPFVLKGKNVLDNEAELRILNPEIIQSQPPKSTPTVGKKPFVSFTEIAEGRANDPTKQQQTLPTQKQQTKSKQKPQTSSSKALDTERTQDSLRTDAPLETAGKQTQQTTQTKASKPKPTNSSKSSVKISSDGRIQNIDDFVKSQVAEQESAKPKDSIKNRIAVQKRKWIDTLSPAEDNFRQAVKDGKISQETFDDIVVKNGKSLRAGTMANLNLVESGLVDLLHGKSKTDYDLLGQTLVAIHSNDLRANKIETGRDAKLDKQIIDKYGKQFEPDIQKFRDAADYVLNKSVESQLISKETADMLKKKYPNYVPMNRVIDEIETNGSFGKSQIASLSKQTVVQKIKGSKKVVENPMESMIAKVQDMSNQALRNEAALAWVDALKTTGDAKLATEAIKPGEATISVLRNGEKEIYIVEPEIEAAAKGLTKEQMNGLTEAARKVSRVFKTGTTGLNPAFIVTNLARDQQTALLNQQRGEAETFKAIPAAIMETFGHGKLYQEAVRQGAISTSFDLTKPNLKQTAENIRKKGAKLGVLSKIEDAIGRSEEYTRVQQYKASKEYWLKQGLSESDAMNKATIAAQQNSADFARAGDVGRILNSWLPYTNAGVQGTRSYLRSAAKNPARYALKSGVMLGMPMIMTALWNYSDDDREEIMNDISEIDKQSNFIVVTPWAKKDEKGTWQNIVKIPKPPGISALMYPIEKAIAQMKGGDPVAFKDLTQAVLGFGSPVGDSLSSAASTITPQAVKPLVETAINRNIYTGRDIVPFWSKNKPPEEQAYKNTSGTARGIGSILNTSPLNVEHAIRGYTGELGLIGLNAIDRGLATTGAIPEEQVGGRSLKNSFSRRFTEAYDKPESEIKGGTTTAPTEQAGSNDRQSLVSTYDDEELRKGMTDTEKTIAKTLKDLPQGLSEEATNEILRYERLNTDTKKRLYKGVQGKLAIEKAWYEKDMLQGTLSESQQYDTEFKIAKLEIAQPYGDRVYDLYGMALYKINTIADDETYNKLVAYDRELFENDLIDKPKFKENRTATSRSGRRASSGGRGGKSGKFSIPSGFSLLPGGSSGSSSSVANLVRNAEVIYRKS